MAWRDQTHRFLKDRLKLERAETVFALLTRGTEGATLFAAALCVAWRLTAQEQGFFFVFTSLGALQQLSDFGMGYSSLQTASHLRTVGNAARFSRFLEQARRINLVLLSSAALLAFFLGAALFLRTTGTTDAQIRWAGPWAAFVVATLAVQLTNLETALIEGGRSASEAWRFR